MASKPQASGIVSIIKWPNVMRRKKQEAFHYRGNSIQLIFNAALCRIS
jgi:hypothetical protein